MNRLSKVLAATAAGAALSLAAAASQAAVYISVDGVNAIASLTDPDDGELATGDICHIAGVNCGGFESVSVTGSAPTAGAGRLHTNAVEVNTKGTGAAAITVWITRTDVSFMGHKQYLAYSNNNQGGKVSTSLQQFYSTSNALFGGTAFEGAFSSNIVGSNSKNSTLFKPLGNGTFSLTQKYTISASADPRNERSASPTMTLSVPEPATWALMIGGFGAAGAMIRRRKVVAA